jgi:hypothetical protein
MDFSLDNYKKPSPVVQMPSWAKSASCKKLYVRGIFYFDLIKSNIDLQIDLPIKERKIVLRRLAKDCSVDPSLLSARRQPDLINFIAQKNAELDEYWISKSSARSVSGRKLKKSELIKQVALLKTELKTLENLRLAEAFTSAIRESLAQSKSELVLLNESLSIENDELKDRNRSLNGQLREMIITLNRVRKD